MTTANDDRLPPQHRRSTSDPRRTNKPHCPLQPHPLLSIHLNHRFRLPSPSPSEPSPPSSLSTPTATSLSQSAAKAKLTRCHPVLYADTIPLESPQSAITAVTDDVTGIQAFSDHHLRSPSPHLPHTPSSSQPLFPTSTFLPIRQKPSHRLATPRHHLLIT